MQPRSLLAAASIALALAPASAWADEAPRAPKPKVEHAPPRPPELPAIPPPELGPAETLPPPPPAPPGARSLADLGLPPSAFVFRAPTAEPHEDPLDLDPDQLDPNRGKRRMMIAGITLTTIGVTIGGLIGAGLLASSCKTSSGCNGRSVGVGFGLVFGSLLIPGVPLIVLSAKTPTRSPPWRSISLGAGPGSAMIRGVF